MKAEFKNNHFEYTQKFDGPLSLRIAVEAAANLFSRFFFINSNISYDAPTSLSVLRPKTSEL